MKVYDSYLFVLLYPLIFFIFYFLGWKFKKREKARKEKFFFKKIIIFIFIRF